MHHSIRQYYRRLIKGWLAGVILGVGFVAIYLYAAPISLDLDHIRQGSAVNASALKQNFEAIQNELNRSNQCANDSVRSGNLCLDKFESSVWYIPEVSGEQEIINAIRNGTITLKQLNDIGAQQLGLATGDFDTTGACKVNGENCLRVFAVSLSGVLPTRFVNWFQASASCRNAFKRLPTNHEWQTAAIGTPTNVPNTNPCKSLAADIQIIDDESVNRCISNVAAFDMEGSVYEWVANWSQGTGTSNTQTTTSPGFGNDEITNVVPAAITANSFPTAIIRGGAYNNPQGNAIESDAGVYAMDYSFGPDHNNAFIGFRCAKTISDMPS